MTAYCTVSEIKAMLPAQNIGSTYDALLADLAEAASRTVDNLLGREPGAFAVSATTTRYFDGNGDSKIWIDEFIEKPVSVAVAEDGRVDNAAGTGGVYTVWADSDYICLPANAPMLGLPYRILQIETMSGTKLIFPRYPKALKVTAKFGFSTTPPPEVKAAVQIQAIRLFKRAQQAFQDVGAVAELSQLRYVGEIDPDIRAMLLKSARFATAERALYGIA